MEDAWVKGRFKTLFYCGSTSDLPVPITVYGSIRGNVGIFKDASLKSPEWKAVHIPSGLGILRAKTLKSAKSAIAEVATYYGLVAFDQIHAKTASKLVKARVRAIVGVH